MTSMLKVVTKTSLIIGLIFLGLLTLSGCEKEKELHKLGRKIGKKYNMKPIKI